GRGRTALPGREGLRRGARDERRRGAGRRDRVDAVRREVVHGCRAGPERLPVVRVARVRHRRRHGERDGHAARRRAAHPGGRGGCSHLLTDGAPGRDGCSRPGAPHAAVAHVRRRRGRARRSRTPRWVWATADGSRVTGMSDATTPRVASPAPGEPPRIHVTLSTASVYPRKAPYAFEA